MSPDYMLYTTIHDAYPDTLFLRRNSDNMELLSCGKDHQDAEMLRRIEACWNACEPIADPENVIPRLLAANAKIPDWEAAVRERDAALARVAELDAKLKAITGSAARAHMEAFKGNIDAIVKLDIDPMGANPILAHCQDGFISTGRARELLRCWVLGTFRHDMLPDEEPGAEYLRALIQDDKSPAEAFGDLLAQLGKVTDYAQRLERIHVTDAEVTHNHICAMRAAVIDFDIQGGAAGMKWIRNTLAGPGFLPDTNAAMKANGDVVIGAAQAHFDAEMAAERTRRADLPDPLPIAEPNAHTLQQTALALVAAAREAGFVLRVYQESDKPLAQGNYRTWVDIHESHPARKKREAAEEKAKQEGRQP